MNTLSCVKGLFFRVLILILILPSLVNATEPRVRRSRTSVSDQNMPIVSGSTTVTSRDTASTATSGASGSNESVSGLSEKAGIGSGQSRPAGDSAISSSYNGNNLYYEVNTPANSTLRTLNSGLNIQGKDYSISVTVPVPFNVNLKVNDSTNPAAINEGESVSVSWTTQGADTCSIDFGGSEGVHTELNNTGVSVTPAVGSKSFQLSCVNGAGVNKDAIVTLTVNALSVTADLKISGSDSPPSRLSGEAFSISWTSTNATSCSVSEASLSGLQNTGTTIRVNTVVPVEKTYTLSCNRGSEPPVTDVVRITINPLAVAALRLNGAVSDLAIMEGQSAVLSWTSTNATSCTMNPGGYTDLTQSGITVNPTVTTTYTLNCNGPTSPSFGATTVTSRITLIVNRLPIMADIKVNNGDGPITINQGSSARLSWTSTSASTCNVNPLGISATASAREDVSPGSSTTYVLTCQEGSNVATDSVRVNVNIPPPPAPRITRLIQSNGSAATGGQYGGQNIFFIEGTNFTNGTIANFGPSPNISTTFVSSSRLQVKAPSVPNGLGNNAVTVLLKVSNSNGEDSFPYDYNGYTGGLVSGKTCWCTRCRGKETLPNVQKVGGTLGCTASCKAIHGEVYTCSVSLP